MSGTTAVRHAFMELDGIRIFYREAGAVDSPVVLLPHGYPCSSYEFRALMPRLADRYRLIAPDFPGSGHSDTPEQFRYDFDGFSELLERFLARLGVHHFVLYLHDFGGWIGLRLAMRNPERVRALIIQNGDIYEDTLGPKYALLRQHWAAPTSASRAQIQSAISKAGFEEEFRNDVRPELAARISPDLWELHWALMTPRRERVALEVIEGLAENVRWFPRYQAYLRERQPPTLIVWGPADGYMPEASARAYLRDLPNAELHLLDGGHWLLETSLDEVVPLARDFLARVHAS